MAAKTRFVTSVPICPCVLFAQIIVAQTDNSVLFFDIAGHFLLTMLLLNDLRRTADLTGEARIVVTSSSLHDPLTSVGVKGMFK